MSLQHIDVYIVFTAGISRAYGGPVSALVISYSLTPVLPLQENQQLLKFSPKTENLLRWVEREVITAIYEDDKKEQLVSTGRSLMFDTRPVMD